MDIILYNPLSRNGRNPKFIKKIAKKISSTQTPKIKNILDIVDVDQFLHTLKKDDRIIIVGGDGTLNRIVNRMYGKHIEQDVFMYKAGTGNDFMRSLKSKHPLISIKAYIQDLPAVYFQDRKQYFLNGAGVGLDGYIGYLVNMSSKKKNKLNYFKNAFKGFLKFKPIEANIQIDDQNIELKKVWLASIMHGPFFGGGMKIAPQADRLKKELHVVVVKDIPKWLLMIIFPTIYLGIHPIFKRYVTIYKAQEVSLSFKAPTYMQIDGDHEFPITSVQCHT